ncbi:MAG: hypothetical protein M3235_17255, partial [Actinomycetota bacterium]|nr:hypothetical protein [Actinomycetota bacterium]
LGVVAAGHLAGAGVLAYAGVPAVSPVVLAVAGVAALVLAVTGPPDAADRRRPRRDRYRMGRLQSTGRSADTDPTT